MNQHTRGLRTQNATETTPFRGIKLEVPIRVNLDGDDMADWAELAASAGCEIDEVEQQSSMDEEPYYFGDEPIDMSKVPVDESLL